jgi:glycosyltransferase involved in cell wall biosynthesis
MIEPRKNLTVLLEAYQHLLDQGSELRLVIAGKKGWLYRGFFERLHELGLEDQVVFPGFVPEPDLPALYSAAELFVFPSLYEGFGLPVLEAMACGTPVVCSNTSSLPEIVGDAAICLHPQDRGAWVAALTEVLENQQLRAELKAKGLARAARFSWQEAARETMAVYRSVLAR